MTEEIKPVYILTNLQIEDMFTKALQPNQFQNLLNKMNVDNIHRIVQKSIANATESRHHIRLVELQFPFKRVRLQEWRENINMLSSINSLVQQT
ncbi:hypothetical protein QQP08_017099 [Theobroma cacao]|nr:hypothetical protein QQP08_017099 [Theobroma cacao]